jgi:hypothetical protein
LRITIRFGIAPAWSATLIERRKKLKKLLQKIKSYFTSRRKQREIHKYVTSIPRDSKGRWIFPEDKAGATVAEIPEELLGNKDWKEVRKVLGDKKTWDVPCMCDMVIGKCVC